MRILRDYRGVSVRMTEERIAHILEHPEMIGLEWAIEKTLSEPERVVASLSDEDARLYYRYYIDTRVGDKLLCVVVKFLERDAFVLTAYLTDKPGRGEIVWSAKS